MNIENKSVFWAWYKEADTYSTQKLMADFRITVEGPHTIDIDTSSWNGNEVTSYDGTVVSEKRSFMYLTPHSFKVTENGESVVYEVNLITGLTSHGYIVRRNGIILAHEP